jgi:heme/copper-type cytochrome/quinol oxidase subunit 2
MARRKEYREEERSASGAVIKYAALALVTVIIIFAAKELLLGRAAPAASGGTANYVANYPVASPPPTINNGVQEVQVSMQGWQYQPNPIRLKVGVPARLVVDLSTVTGCMRSIQIPSLGVAKYVSQGDNVIEFTPSKAGTFRMQCSMGMGRGVVVVEESGGAVPTTTDLNGSAPAGSCGAGGGGCGCGGAR